MDRTIAAIATPAGNAGIAVIRISGNQALDIAEKIFFNINNKKISEMKGYTAGYGYIKDKEEVVDTGIIIVFKNPKSYTGEDVVEISCHGGYYLAQKILKLVLDNGARIAQPGEFTKRAFLNGKINLTQAESVMDIISGKSDYAVKMAVSASEGKLSLKIKEIIEDLINISAYMAAWFDFPEEDIEELYEENIKISLDKALNMLKDLLNKYNQGRMIREGISAAIAGKPNVGKSTLMNLLADKEKSIVTDIPGTTRDIVEEYVKIGPYVFNLADTAGLRNTEDVVESIGVTRAEKRIQDAEIVFAVFDSSKELSSEDHELIEKIKDKKCIAIINKIDLENNIDTSILEKYFENIIYLSAKDGNGIEKLISACEKMLLLENFDANETFLANERQLECAKEAYAFLVEAKESLEYNQTFDAISILFESAIDSLLKLTGEKASEKTIETVFERFCVGK